MSLYFVLFGQLVVVLFAVVLVIIHAQVDFFFDSLEFRYPSFCSDFVLL